MRWKPAGKTCIRKRRMNSCAGSVITLLYRSFETIILPLEGNVLVVGRDQTAVGDGDAVGVARKVAQDFLRSPEWALGIDDPVFVAQRRQIGREGSCVCERSVLAEELQLAGAMSDSKLLQDQPAEQARENAHVDEKVGPAGDPALTIGRDAAARHDHVDMRMVGERRAPGVEHGEKANAGAEVF